MPPDPEAPLDRPFLVVDYSSWWRLPPPLPPKRWPRALLVLDVAVIVYALAFAM